MTYAVVALVALAAVAAVAWPLLRGPSDAAPPGPDPDRLEQDAAIDRSLAAIEEIDFDYRAGNLSEEDFVALDRLARVEAADLLRRRDAPVPGRSGGDRSETPQ